MRWPRKIAHRGLHITPKPILMDPHVQFKHRNDNQIKFQCSLNRVEDRERNHNVKAVYNLYTIFEQPHGTIHTSHKNQNLPYLDHLPSALKTRTRTEIMKMGKCCQSIWQGLQPHNSLWCCFCKFTVFTFYSV